MRIVIFIAIVCSLPLTWDGTLYAQDSIPKVTFQAVNSISGFDTYEYEEWSENYPSYNHPDSNKYVIPYKSVATDSVDSILMNWSNLSLKQRERVNFVIHDSNYVQADLDITKDSVKLILPASKYNYRLDVLLDDHIIGKIYVRVYERHKENLIIVPLLHSKLKGDSIEDYLNTIYGQAQLEFSVSIKPRFKYEKFSKRLLDNPSEQKDRYTEQMQEIRDAYFEANPKATKSAYYIFITPGFVQDDIQGFMVRSKSVGFVKTGKDLKIELARQLGYGIGDLKDSWENDGPGQSTTNNLMDLSGGFNLTMTQWDALQQGCRSYMPYDDYEDVRTNSGMVAFYLWEEDANGNILISDDLFLKSIKRPYKRNQYSYHLDITNFFFKPLFQIQNYRINILHFLGVILMIIGLIIASRKTIRWIKMNPINLQLTRWIARFILFVVFSFLFFELFFIINKGYSMYEVESGEVKEFEGLSMKKTLKLLKGNHKNPLLGEEELGSQLLVKKHGKWILKRRKKVLYFSSQMIDGKMQCRFISDSDSLSLSTLDFSEQAQSHYMVVNYLDASGNLESQRIFNHLGSDITAKMKLKNPAKRILVFVNGYRPTSTKQTIEENFYDITQNGLEHPKSSNMIYDFDRYNYWERWKEMNLRFAARINPEETYYADGHFSVTTSNHRSLVGFTTLSGVYPERCRNMSDHICKNEGVGGLFSSSSQKTVTLFNLDPNEDGFNERKENGTIAGRNLIQRFNEIPNKSDNDTLFIVCHSMGFAYALGIIDELRGKINFGGFYIIAPENASSGTIKMSEWEEIWQYGSDFERHKFKAPCLLDGVAPQTKVGGLNKKFRAYIPNSEYRKKGFFKSHFIGNYTWIFDVKKGKPGYIRQR